VYEVLKPVLVEKDKAEEYLMKQVSTQASREQGQQGVQ
jgi:hypothetical protein